MTREKFRSVTEEIMRAWNTAELQGPMYELAPHNINISLDIMETALRDLKELKRVWDREQGVL